MAILQYSSTAIGNKSKHVECLISLMFVELLAPSPKHMLFVSNLCYLSVGTLGWANQGRAFPTLSQALLVFLPSAPSLSLFSLGKEGALTVRTLVSFGTLFDLRLL